MRKILKELKVCASARGLIKQEGKHPEIGACALAKAFPMTAYICLCHRDLIRAFKFPLPPPRQVHAIFVNILSI